MNQLGFSEAVYHLGEGVVIRVTDASDRRDLFAHLKRILGLNRLRLRGNAGGERRVHARRHRPEPPETGQALPENGLIGADRLRKPISSLFEAINAY